MYNVKKNRNQSKDDIQKPRSSPLVGGVLLPGLAQHKLGVGGLERAAGVQRDEVAFLGNLLGGVDGAGDLQIDQINT